MLKNLRNNKRGVVFITVLMIILVLMVLTISIISLNVSQIGTTMDEVHQIQAEALASGALSFFLANQLSGTPSNTITYTQILDNITFTILANIIDPLL